MLKQVIKGALQHTAAAIGPHRWPARGPALIILMYHRILPPGDPRYVDEQPGMIVHPETFAMHLNVVQQHAQVVSLSDWVARADAGEPLPKRACAITFDDGWRDNLEFALPALRDSGLPATIFLVSDMMDEHGSYWPEDLAAAIRLAQDAGDRIWQGRAFRWLANLHPAVKSATDREKVDAAIVAAKTTLDDEALREHSRKMLAALGDQLHDQPRAILNWDEAREMQRGGLIEFGSHTLDHTRLTDALPEDACRRQLAESQRIIGEQLDQPVPLFCYPNGDHSAVAVEQAATLYAAAVTTRGGWNTPSTERHKLHRIGIHEGNAGTSTAFRARLSGWM